MNGKTILVLGGSGFVGRHLVSRLVADGNRVVVPTRSRERARHLILLPTVDVIEADVHDPLVLGRLVRGAAAAVNLVGILNESGDDGRGFHRAHVELTQAVNNALPIAHPLLAMTGIAGVVFTGPAHDPEAHLRTVSVSGAGAVNWCPGGTAMSAIMSVLDAMQLLPDGATFVQEGLFGTLFHGRIVGRTIVGELPALMTEIEGSAWITGEHTLHLDDDDPLKEGVGAQ